MRNARGVRNMCTLKNLKDVTPGQLRAKAGIDANAIPLDMDELLRSWKIVAAPTDFSDIEHTAKEQLVRYDGAILGTVGARDGHVFISYSAKSSLNQIYYTIAHELGHCSKHTGLLEHGHTLTLLAGTFPPQMEKDADAYALDLLLPKDGLKEKYLECLKMLNIDPALKLSHDIIRKIICYLSHISKVPGVHVESRLFDFRLIDCRCS